MSELPRLIRPSPDLREAVCDMSRDHRESGEHRYAAAEEDYAAWLAKLGEGARGENLEPGRVPLQVFCLAQAGRVLGCSRLRLELNEGLLQEGGNIGYDIRPSDRGRGLGTLILALTLEEAARQGLSRARLTCDDDNLRSWKVIERNGGRLDGRSVSEESGKLVRQYWIKVPADGLGCAHPEARS